MQGGDRVGDSTDRCNCLLPKGPNPATDTTPLPSFACSLPPLPGYENRWSTSLFRKLPPRSRPYTVRTKPASPFALSRGPGWLASSKHPAESEFCAWIASDVTPQPASQSHACRRRRKRQSPSLLAQSHTVRAHRTQRGGQYIDTKVLVLMLPPHTHMSWWTCTLQVISLRLTSSASLALTERRLRQSS